MLDRDAIFTNVATTADNQPWWEGKSNEVPATDWHGQAYQANQGPAAHPNSRFTVPIKRCPSYSDQSEAAHGVPISAIVFGGRRASLVPLVNEARDWSHGVLMGASMASETTAAATGAVGIVRRDPMAMKPFCGYNFADYWSHWLSMQDKSDQLPKVFTVNWFRKDENGRFMWPGFGENLRVLQWMVGRCKGSLGATESAIGYLPKTEDLDIAGLDLEQETLEALLSVDHAAWRGEMQEISQYLDTYGHRVPSGLRQVHKQISDGLNTQGSQDQHKVVNA